MIFDEENFEKLVKIVDETHGVSGALVLMQDCLAREKYSTEKSHIIADLLMARLLSQMVVKNPDYPISLRMALSDDVQKIIDLYKRGVKDKWYHS